MDKLLLQQQVLERLAEDLWLMTAPALGELIESTHSSLWADDDQPIGSMLGVGIRV